MAGSLVDLLAQGFSLKNLKNESLEGDFSLGSFLPRFVLVPPSKFDISFR